MTYAFLITIADEGVPQLDLCLGSLRAAYPDACVHVISDGAPNPGYNASCKRHKVEYTEGTFLKRVECGGLWWKRFFEIALKSDAEWFIKLDPDTKFFRPFHEPPKYLIAGTLKGSGTEVENIQGGCQAIHRVAATNFMIAGYYNDPFLTNPKSFARDDADYRQIHALAYFSTDKSLIWMARQLGISHGPWPEVASNWKPPAPEGDYAATHPHKLNTVPRFRNVPLRVITTCKGRLEHLKQTLPTWVSEPDVAVTVVDFDCPDGTTAWLRANYPQVQVVEARGLPKFNLSAARNLGAKYAAPGWWCLFDADWLCQPGWSRAVRELLRHRHYYLASPIEWGQFGSVVTHSDDYKKAGGYDELFQAWGWEDGDFYARLRQIGIRPDSMPSEYFRSLKHGEAERTQFYDVKKVSVSCSFYGSYVKDKIRFMLENDRVPKPYECKRIIHAVAKRFPDLPRELVTFNELAPTVTDHSQEQPMSLEAPAPGAGAEAGRDLPLSGVPAPPAPIVITATAKVPVTITTTTTTVTTIKGTPIAPAFRLSSWAQRTYDDFIRTMTDRGPHLDPRVRKI